MSRALIVLAVVVVLLGGGVATTGSFTDGDEVATDSGVYLSPADSENADRYVAYDDAGELRIRFGSVPPDARTSVDNLFLVGFAGYEGNDSAATIEIDTDADGVTLYRMDTGERVTGGEITLDPNASVTLGATIPPSVGSYTESVRFTVDVPEDDAGSGPGGDTGGGDGGTGGGAGGGGSDGGPSDSGDGDGTGGDDGTGGNDGGTGSGSGGDGAGIDDSGAGSDGGDDDTADDGTGDDGTSGSGSGTDGGDSGTGGDGDSTDGDADGGDDDSDEADDDSDAGDGTDDGEADGTADDVSDSAESGPTAEPAGGQFELLPAGWSLFAGFLAGLSNYLVQTRIRGVVPALKTEQSERRARLRSILAREAVVMLAVMALTVLVAGALSGAGITGITQLIATLGFSAIVGGLSGAREFPRI